MRVERVLFGAVLLAGGSLAVDASLSTAAPTEIVASAPAAPDPTSLPAAAFAAAADVCYDYAGGTEVPCPTAAPTTVAPTTVAPTTVAPTTVAPTTVAPTTVAPTTVAPTTVAPTTVAPTTLAPTTLPTVLDDDHVEYRVTWRGDSNLDLVLTVGGTIYGAVSDVNPATCGVDSSTEHVEYVIIPRSSEAVSLAVVVTEACDNSIFIRAARETTDAGTQALLGGVNFGGATDGQTINLVSTTNIS